MDWIVELFTQPTYLQAVIFICIVSATGLAFGEIKFKGVSLGVTFVFFAGIVLGDLLDKQGIETNWQMISLAQNFGLILFIYTLGLQVGPSFFPSLAQGGIKLNLLGLLAVVLTTAMALVFSALKIIPFTESVGLLCGAATNTPMLGAAQQAMLDVYPDRIQDAADMASACAVGYPIGVLGVLVSIIIFKVMAGSKTSSRTENSTEAFVAEFHISNPAIFGMSIKEVAALSEKKHLIISRIWRNGKVSIPVSDTILEKDDHILAVLRKDDLQSFLLLFGEKDAKDWNRPDIDWDSVDAGRLVSKHVLVTKKGLNGVKIGALHLRNSYNINITRINRAGIQLVASPNMRLQLGDRLTVVGEEKAIKKVGEILGNEQKELANPNLVAIFFGMFLGVFVGMIPLLIPGMSVPVKLGVAGGPILVGILMGAFGYRFHFTTYTTRSANMMLKQVGIVIYLACLGLTSGRGFFSTILSLQGLVWIAVSLAIAIVPVVLTGLVASKAFKLDFAQNAGMLCASMANPIVLSYANSVTDENEASEAYATVYPFSMFIRVLSAQLLMLIFI